MSGLQTVGEIVTYLDGLLGGGASSVPSEPVPAAPVAVEDSGVRRFVLRSVERAASGFALTGLVDAEHIAITGDDFGVGPQLQTLLAQRGIKAALVNEVKPEHDGVIFLGGLTREVEPEAQLRINVSAFEAARTVAETMTGRGGFFVSVQSTGGRFGLGGVHRPWTGGLSGLVKTASHEWPLSGLKAVDVEGAGGVSPEEIAARLAEELCGGGDDLEVGLTTDGRRHVLESVPEEVDFKPQRLPKNPVMVVSGGGRGVTAATVVALAREQKGHFALLGRTSLDGVSGDYEGVLDSVALKRVLLDEAKARGETLTPRELGARVRKVLAVSEINATLAALRAAGAKAEYYAVDVTDHEAVGKTLGEVREKWGPITGVIHGAGVLADRLIKEKTSEEFNRVFHTKINGLRALMDATSSDPLSQLVLFSSVAARAGNRGQCDYAMANEILNKAAVAEAASRGEKCSVKSFNWGPWAGGMVTPELERQFNARGIPLIPMEEGARRLVFELGSECVDEVEITIGGEPVLSKHDSLSEGAPREFKVLVDSSSHGFCRTTALSESRWCRWCW